MSFRIPYRGAGLAFIKKDGSSFSVFMGKRSRFPFFASWTIPGGSVEKSLNENELTAAKREFYEETGIKPDVFMERQLGSWTKTMPFFRWTTFFFLTDENFDNAIPNEFFKLKWIPYGSLKRYYRRPFTRSEMRFAEKMFHTLP